MSRSASSNKDTEVTLCYHCGNKTLMRQVAQHDHVEEYVHDDWVAMTFGTTWKLFFCPVCSNVTLRRSTWNDQEVDWHGNVIVTIKDVYPMSHDNDKLDIPGGVHQALEAAMRVRNIDHAICVLALRRTLEKLCKDQGAAGRDLYTKIQELTDRDILPPILNDMAGVLRVLGNAAAHADDSEFDEIMVSQLIEFTQTIVDYVYVLPKQLMRIQQRVIKGLSDITKDDEPGEAKADDEETKVQCPDWTPEAP